MMLFEDSPNSPISILLKSIFGSEIDFSGGCNRMFSLISKYVQSEDFVLVFYDYVLDNEDTVQGYNALVRKIKKYGNVGVVKIPCIEFFALQLLLNLDLIKDSSTKVNLFKKSLNEKILHKERSYEVFCKSVLNGYPLLCVHNACKGKVPFTGSFWLNNCPFEKSKCEGLVRSNRCSINKEDLCLSEKADMFIQLLPCLFTSKELNGFKEDDGDERSCIHNVNKQMNEKYYSKWV